MTTRLFACMLAGSLMVPQLAPGADANLISRQAALPAQTDALALPAIRHLETIPWLFAVQRAKGNALAGLEAPGPTFGSMTGRLGQFPATTPIDRRR